jgi:hypothetical protein
MAKTNKSNITSGDPVYIISAWYGVDSPSFGKPFPVANQVLYVVTTSLERAIQYIEDYFNQRVELANDVSPTHWYGYVTGPRYIKDYYNGKFRVQIEKTYVY